VFVLLQSQSLGSATAARRASTTRAAIWRSSGKRRYALARAFRPRWNAWSARVERSTRASLRRAANCRKARVMRRAAWCRRVTAMRRRVKACRSRAQLCSLTNLARRARPRSTAARCAATLRRCAHCSAMAAAVSRNRRATARRAARRRDHACSTEQAARMRLQRATASMRRA